MSPNRILVMRIVVGLFLVLGSLAAARGGEPPSRETVRQIIDAVGGEARLLKLFRIKERLVLGEDPKGKAQTRVSVLEPPDHWWVGKRERVSAEGEPATFLVWAWTLGPLVDPRSKLESLKEITIDDRPMLGIRIRGTIDPPLDMYFDKKSMLLVRIDWRKDKHVFGDWKEVDGLKYPAQTTGYRASGKAWYFSDITEIERLNELPRELKRVK